MRKSALPPEIVPATPQNLGVTPRYVLLHNALARSASTLSAPALKLAAMSLALLPSDLSTRTAAFTFTQFCKALSLKKGGESYKAFLAAVDECMDCKIHIERVSPKGKRSWEKFTWFTYSSFDETTGQATMILSEHLALKLTSLKREYTKLSLQIIGKFQSRYAIALYGCLMSFSYLAGKQGNASGTWYHEDRLEDIRFRSGVPEGSYIETKSFIKDVIRAQFKALKANGTEVTIKSIKLGRETIAILFTCKVCPRLLQVKQDSSRKKASTGQASATTAPAEAVALPTKSPKDEHYQEDKELEHLRELFPEEYASLYTTALEQSPPFLPDDETRRHAAHTKALLALRFRHGIVK